MELPKKIAKDTGKHWRKEQSILRELKDKEFLRLRADRVREKKIAGAVKGAGRHGYPVGQRLSQIRRGDHIISRVRQATVAIENQL
jgi:hypothetical protein